MEALGPGRVRRHVLENSSDVQHWRSAGGRVSTVRGIASRGFHSSALT
jgi:hypothetical protein